MHRHLTCLCLILPGMCLALDAPTVTTSATTNGDTVFVHLDWSPVEGANSYTVYESREWPQPPQLIRNVFVPGCDIQVPTGWSWNYQPDVLGFYSVRAKSSLLTAFTPVPAGTFGMSWGSGFAVTLTHPFLFSLHETTNVEFAAAAQWAVDHGHAQVSGGNLVAYGQTLLQMTSSYCEISYASGNFSLRLAPGGGAWGFDNMHYNPALHPVKMVSWYGAACFCDWLSLMDGLPAYYQGLWSQIPSIRNPYAATGYRLPTEAEWEYVAQFNPDRSRIQFPWGNDAANCAKANHLSGDYCVGWSSEVETHPDGASSLDVQDMGGNVWEWCNDWYGAYNQSPQTNPVGSGTGSSRIVRGGSWSALEGYSAMQNAARGYYAPGTLAEGVGFRVGIVQP